jgi:hypothetical protein
MTDARDEAKRRYPYLADGPFSAVLSDLNAARQSAFIAGAQWQAEQPVGNSGKLVEAAAIGWDAAWQQCATPMGYRWRLFHQSTHTGRADDRDGCLTIAMNKANMIGR